MSKSPTEPLLNRPDPAFVAKQLEEWREPKWMVIDGLETVSEANVASSKHWWHRAERANQQRTTVCDVLSKMWPIRPLISEDDYVVVTLTRMSPRLLDSGDNITTSQKHVKDGLADWLKTNDRNPRILWRFEQKKHHEYAVKIMIETKCEHCVCCKGKGYQRKGQKVEL